MPPRVVLCDLCGGKFFPHSIGHHQKSCRGKVGKTCIDCPYCGGGVPRLQMDAHILKCPEAIAAGAKPTGQSLALATKLQRANERQAGGKTAQFTETEDDRQLGSAGFSVPEQVSENDDCRIECGVCGRKFNMDRIAKHQAVCQKISSKKPRKTFQVTRTYNEGGSKGAVIGMVRGPPKRPEPTKTSGPATSKPTSKWREESKAFREAIRDARQHPMPLWGQDNLSSGRGTGRVPATTTFSQSGLRSGGGAGPRAKARVSSPKAPGSPTPGGKGPQTMNRGNSVPASVSSTSRARGGPVQRRAREVIDRRAAGVDTSSSPTPASVAKHRPRALPTGGNRSASPASIRPSSGKRQDRGLGGWGRECMTGPAGGGGIANSNETSFDNPLSTSMPSCFRESPRVPHHSRLGGGARSGLNNNPRCLGLDGPPRTFSRSQGPSRPRLLDTE